MKETAAERDKEGSGLLGLAVVSIWVQTVIGYSSLGQRLALPAAAT